MDKRISFSDVKSLVAEAYCDWMNDDEVSKIYLLFEINDAETMDDIMQVLYEVGFSEEDAPEFILSAIVLPPKKTNNT